MERRRTYDTRQKRLVRSVLVQAPDRYFSVDEAHFSLMEVGESVGRTTVYRALEALADDGFAVKVFGPGGMTLRGHASNGGFSGRAPRRESPAADR